MFNDKELPIETRVDTKLAEGLHFDGEKWVNVVKSEPQPIELIAAQAAEIERLRVALYKIQIACEPDSNPFFGAIRQIACTALEGTKHND
jgi:hypothetical protein